MRNFFAFIPLVCLSVILLHSCDSQSCSKKIPCPGYDGAVLDDWFPYHDGQKITFKDSLNNAYLISFILADSTVPYDITNGFDRPNQNCSSRKLFTSVAQKDSAGNYINFSISLNNSLAQYTNTAVKSVVFNLGNNNFYGNNLTASGIQYFNVSYSNGYTNNIYPRTLTDYSLNGTNYSLAQSITNDSAFLNNLDGVYEVTYAKGDGIIEFKSNPGNITWIKQ
ncbi:hypothetical protein [Ferruginibacter albus]|uniref:hypothetical protein n=1 Tax=Ferruginibacter albus TaxID=2875540 RepID=UPI001CC771FA|nr:hypothetical protein [Ferruginibacter albus]UAY51807.1 hypothetical protein K9M53_14590 [Ferruginibacter albus]